MTSEPSAPSEAARDEALHELWLRRYPLRLGVRASEHYQAVLREFALLASTQPSGSVPERLLALVDELGRRYANNNAHEVQRDEALARGEEVLDIVVRVPQSVRDVSRTLDRMLDETDDFCRDGTLLTLAPADDVVAFRHWYLGELVAQLDGAAARPWTGETR